METAAMSTEVFLRHCKREEVDRALTIFAYENKGNLPGFLHERRMPGRFLVDVIPVAGVDVFLPVIARSTGWLGACKGISGFNLEACNHSEIWGTQGRFALIGGMNDMNKYGIEKTLYQFLKSIADHQTRYAWHRLTRVSERVSGIAQTEQFKKLLEWLRVILLPAEYREKKVYIDLE